MTLNGLGRLFIPCIYTYVYIMIRIKKCKKKKRIKEDDVMDLGFGEDMRGVGGEEKWCGCRAHA